MERRDEPVDGLGGLLRDLRRRRGLTQRELAALTGLPAPSIAAIELGREPRHSLLRRLLSRVPGLTAADLLGRMLAGPACPAAWRAHRELQGFAVRRLVKRLGIDDDGLVTELVAEGVRPLPRIVDDPEHWTALMRCVLEGSIALLDQLRPENVPLPGRWSLEEGDASQDFVFPDDWMRRGFESRHRARAGATDESPRVELEVRYPIERLELRCPRPSSTARPLCLAWSWLADDDVTELDLGPLLFPDGPELRNEGDETTWVIRRPTIGLIHSLRWTDDAATSSRESAKRPPLATVVSTARKRSGLSLRQLGERMGVAPNTLRAVERGSEPKLSILRGLTDALPELVPQQLLPAVATTGVLDLDELWEHDHRVHGLAADELHKLVEVDADGTCAITMTTRGLRSLQPQTREMSVRSGLWRKAVQGQPRVLRAIETDVEAKARVVERRLGKTVHRLTFSGRAGSTGVTYVRRFDRAPLYALTEERGRSRVPEPPPYWEGTSLTPAHPARRLTILVRFPDGYWPLEPRAHAWPLAHVPGLADDQLEVSLPRDRFRLERRKSTSTLRLRIERPPMALQFALSWRLPPR
ncbi:MAG: helix-turn-helix transcriptional regulator [Acidobacteriota bacterium]